MCRKKTMPIHVQYLMYKTIHVHCIWHPENTFCKIYCLHYSTLESFIACPKSLSKFVKKTKKRLYIVKLLFPLLAWNNHIWVIAHIVFVTSQWVHVQMSIYATYLILNHCIVFCCFFFKWVRYIFIHFKTI